MSRSSAVVIRVGGASPHSWYERLCYKYLLFLSPRASWISGDINPTGLLNTIIYFVVLLTEIISTVLDMLGSHVADAYG